MMSRPRSHLTGRYPKPRGGEYVPITFLDFQRVRVGWSPEEKRSIYIDSSVDPDKLRRVREVSVLTVINHLSGGISTIELTDAEREQFEEVYDRYLKEGGQILFTRRKTGSTLISFFELKSEEKKREEKVERRLLSEKL